MKRRNEGYPIFLNSDDSEEYDSDLSERGKRTRPPVQRRRRRRTARASDEDEEPPQMKALRRATKLQHFIYLIIITGLIIHLITTVAMLLKLPGASFLLVFHGIVSPSTIILYVVGAFSGLYGWMSLFRREDRASDEAKSRRFRRYIRVNKYLLLCWILASQATVFGCWKFIFSQDLDKTVSRAELVRNPSYDSIVRLVIEFLPKVLTELSETDGIQPDDPPLDLLRYVGIHYVLFLFLLSVIPGIMLYVGIWFQQKYYALRFMSDSN